MEAPYIWRGGTRRRDEVALRPGLPAAMPFSGYGQRRKLAGGAATSILRPHPGLSGGSVRLPGKFYGPWKDPAKEAAWSRSSRPGAGDGGQPTVFGTAATARLLTSTSRRRRCPARDGGDDEAARSTSAPVCVGVEKNVLELAEAIGEALRERDFASPSWPRHGRGDRATGSTRSSPPSRLGWEAKAQTSNPASRTSARPMPEYL